MKLTEKNPCGIQFVFGDGTAIGATFGEKVEASAVVDRLVTMFQRRSRIVKSKGAKYLGSKSHVLSHRKLTVHFHYFGREVYTAIKGIELSNKLVHDPEAFVDLISCAFDEYEDNLRLRPVDGIVELPHRRVHLTDDAVKTAELAEVVAADDDLPF